MTHEPSHRHGVLGWCSRTKAEYESGGDDERPLAGYALLITGYGIATGVAWAIAARRRRGAPLPGVWDLLLLTVSVFQTTRTISKDAVMSPLRAPFTVFTGPAGPGEVMESPRSGPVRHAVGELITCPFCLGQWVATAALVSWAASPTATRWATRTMAVVAGSSALHYAYAALEKTDED